MMHSRQEMMKSVKANLSQKSSKLRYFNRKIETDQEFTAIKDAPTLSTEELEAFSTQFKEELSKWKIKIWCMTLIACGLLFTTLYFLFFKLWLYFL